jgi:hypothetical protein
MKRMLMKEDCIRFSSFLGPSRHIYQFPSAELTCRCNPLASVANAP